jgi:flavin reductase ActVB
VTEDLRAALPRVPTAVSVVTTLDDGGAAWGVTVGTLCLLSFTPPLVSFSLDRRNASHDVFTGTGRFLVHVLRDDQAEVASRFARRGAHDFADDHVTVRGLPSFADSLARFACVQHALIPGGDHTIVIGLVEGVEIHGGAPLLYYERRYGTVSSAAPVALEAGNGRVR